jgi:serine-type D-Ala-D-Ala carboxypeptidase
MPTGINAARLVRAVDILTDGIAAGAMPGATVCLFHRGKIVLHEAMGTLDGTRPASLSTIYDLASITKPMATGASLLFLVENGQIALTAMLPELLGKPAAHLANVTVRHLLTHTSGLPAWTPCYDNGPGLEAAVEAILRLPSAPPGTKYEYSCLNFILLHQIIETVAGKSLDEFARETVHAPLGLTDTMYRPPDTLRDRVAPTISREGPQKNETLRGIVHDGNARGIGGVSGNAGLFGTAKEVAMFGEALRTGQIFGAPTRARIFANQVEPSVGAHTFLFFAQGNGFCPAGDLLSAQAVGHSGFTGTLLTIDPTHALTIAVLTNSVFGDGKASWLTLRRRFLNVIASAV